MMYHHTEIEVKPLNDKSTYDKVHVILIWKLFSSDFYLKNVNQYKNGNFMTHGNRNVYNELESEHAPTNCTGERARGGGERKRNQFRNPYTFSHYFDAQYLDNAYFSSVLNSRS